MDIMTIIGIIGGLVCIVMSVITSGGTLGGIWDFPSFIFTVIGSYTAMCVAYPMKYVVGVWGIIGRTFKIPSFNEKLLIENMINLSEKARREGILALEEALEDLDDEFLKDGLRMVVDGTDGIVIRTIMENEIAQSESRHLQWISVINTWAGLGPGYGMMGTVIGLIGMLNNLEDKSSLGPNMAIALLTTLYGSFIANMFMVPFANKLQGHNNQEMIIKEMIVEGVLSIQAGDNPRILGQKLLTYLDPETAKAVRESVIKD